MRPFVPGGPAYLAAMAAAANYGRANRQLLTEAARRVFEQDRDIRLLYDVSHNLAKIETHEVHGRESPCVCIGKARPAHCRRAIPTCPPISRRSVSRC